MTGRPIVFVHGFRYDPRKPGPDHPEHHTYPRWREMLPERRVVPFTWFSNPSLWDAWRHRRWNRYRRAWDMAGEAAEGLQRLLRELSSFGSPDVLCHSLGSYVTLLALRQGAPAHRVLILNGAAYSHDGEDIAKARPEVKFYNVVVQQDDVLNLLARFAPGSGNRFLGVDGATDTENWRNLVLGESGDNPEKMGDHHYSYENEANWPLYRTALNGKFGEASCGSCA